MPLCFGASGSVRTNVRITSASCAPDVHTFCPLTTKCSPSRTAEVRSDARSDPAPGSLMPSAAVISARRIGTAQRCFCSSVPNDSSDAAMMPTPLRVEALVDRALRQLFAVDVLLQDGGVAAAELRRVAGQQPAVVEHAAAASAGPTAGTSAVDRERCDGVGLVGQVLVEERDELVAEGLDVGVEGQLHWVTTPGAASAARR